MLLTTSDYTILTLVDQPLQYDIELLLFDFGDVFQLPTGFPPIRLQYHKILLQNEAQVVKVRPYRYLAIQKNKIERLIKEMLDIGIVRNSNSLFALPIVMVKEKDESWRLCVDYQ